VIRLRTREETRHGHVRRQRGHRAQHRAWNAQPFATGRHDPQRPRVAEHGADDLGARLDEVLTAVQHQEQLALAQILEERRAHRSLLDARSGADRATVLGEPA
jgi:hypothetical protein